MCDIEIIHQYAIIYKCSKECKYGKRYKIHGQTFLLHNNACKQADSTKNIKTPAPEGLPVRGREQTIG